MILVAVIFGSFVLISAIAAGLALINGNIKKYPDGNS
jgi:hypothetical protein